MILAHRAINAKLHEERLPSLDYRISADYGIVQVARSRSLQGDDLFGSTVNVCAKINSKASANGMVIGNNLYQITKAFDDYVYKEVEGYGIGSYQKYPVYSITSKTKRTMLNPFKRTVE
jgi:class 3 adenylate cyclase